MQKEQNVEVVSFNKVMGSSYMLFGFLAACVFVGAAAAKYNQIAIPTILGVAMLAILVVVPTIYFYIKMNYSLSFEVLEFLREGFYIITIIVPAFPLCILLSKLKPEVGPYALIFYICLVIVFRVWIEIKFNKSKNNLGVQHD